jgi:hypothetical protein
MEKVKKCKHRFKLLNSSNLKRNPVDSLYYYQEGDFKVLAECTKCAKQLSHKTIITILNKENK